MSCLCVSHKHSLDKNKQFRRKFLLVKTCPKPFADLGLVLRHYKNFSIKKPSLVIGAAHFETIGIAVNTLTMEFIYPKNGSKIILLKFEGNKNDLFLNLHTQTRNQSILVM